MQAVKTIGLDIAKSGFQVHGVDADGQVVFRRQLKRRNVLAFLQKVPSCLVGMEATSHHWSRELQALGHTVRLMPPAYVKPYVKRGASSHSSAGRGVAAGCARTASVTAISWHRIGGVRSVARDRVSRGQTNPVTSRVLW